MQSHPYKSADFADGILSISLSDSNVFENAIRVLEFAQTDDSVQVVVLRDEGPQLEKKPPVTTATASQETAVKFAQCLRQMPQPIVAMSHGQVQDFMKVIWDACDIVFANGDWATLSFLESELEAQTYQLARELATKDPLALRFTKKTVQQVASVAWDDILNFTTSQQAEIKSLQAGRPSTRALAIESFLAGKSKPGAGA
jgi:enoyl-CoA hydratase/carnithine racemase